MTKKEKKALQEKIDRVRTLELMHRNKADYDQCLEMEAWLKGYITTPGLFSYFSTTILEYGDRLTLDFYYDLCRELKILFGDYTFNHMRLNHD